MELLLVIAALLYLFVPIFFIGAWVLAPIDRAAKAYDGPRRIALADVLCLFIAIQLPLAGVNFTRGEETEFHFWILTVLTFVAAPVIWITCAQTLSRAGISEAKYRLPFMAIVLPLAYYGLFVLMIVPPQVTDMLVNKQPLELLPFLGLVALWLVVAIGLVVSGFYIRWIIRQSHLAPAAPSETPFDADADG